MKTKSCIECKAEKPLDEFYCRRKPVGGVMKEYPYGRCIKCHNEYSGNYRLMYPEKIKAYNRKRYVN